MAVYTYRGREVGTADEAARICGVGSGETYQYYTRRLGAPKAVTWREPSTGKQLYPLAEVTKWHRSRPGRGARTDLRTRRETGSASTPPKAAEVASVVVLTPTQIRALLDVIGPDPDTPDLAGAVAALRAPLAE